ncbi:hypothetical protein [Floccifex sp.]|uniref:hypothetical protein n=1 Tax=Floccifex sp. TaxID=2815810 RepID=UPI003EFC2944
MSQNIKVDIRKTKGYTLIWQEMNQDLRLKNKDVGLLVRLLSLPPDWRFSETGLCKRFDIGKHELRTELEKLEYCGYLTRVQTRDESGRFSGSNWIIYDVPQNNNALPLSDFQTSEKPVTENQTQLNTKELNTKKLNNLSQKKQSFYCTLKQTSEGLIDEYCYNCYLINKCPFETRMLMETECLDPYNLSDDENSYLMETVFFRNRVYDITQRLKNGICLDSEKQYFGIVEDCNGSKQE